MKVPYYKGKNRSQAFFLKFGHYGPKIALNDQKWAQQQQTAAAAANSSKDFSDFSTKLGDDIWRKITKTDFFPKIPVFRILGPKTHFGTRKIENLKT